jgi:hypothetical protein
LNISTLFYHPVTDFQILFIISEGDPTERKEQFHLPIAEMS